jgi:hypothetical protein
MTFWLKSAALALFKQGIFSTLIRALVAALIVFFVLPMLFPSVQPLITKVQLSIVAVLLLEFIAYRAYSALGMNQSTPVRKVASKVLERKLKMLLYKKNLSLFLHSKSVSICDLVPRSIYLGLDIDESYGEGIKVFDHYEKPIVAVELETCRQILKNPSAHIEVEKIFAALKNSASDAITLAIHVRDVTDANTRKEFFLKLQSCANIIGAYFGGRRNVNLILDGMQCISGFGAFAHLAENTDASLLSVIMPVNAKDELMLFEVFDQKFWEFSERIDRAIMSTNFENTIDAQLCLMFSQQLQYLKEQIKDLIGVAVKLFRASSISYKNNIFFEVHFLDSLSSFKEQGDIIPKELQLCHAK